MARKAKRSIAYLNHRFVRWRRRYFSLPIARVRNPGTLKNIAENVGRGVRRAAWVIVLGGPPARAEILYEKNCADCLWLALTIMGSLKAAKWEIAKYGPLEEPAADKAHLSASMAAGGAVHGGVTILGKPPLDWVDLKNKPFASLHAALVCGGVGGDKALTGMADDKLPEGLIRIIVAPRP
jgi:hypothetical protein